MYYVIQENLFREYGFKALIEHLDKLKGLDKLPIWPGNVDYEIVKYIPFSEQLEVKTDRKDVFFFGSSNAGMVAKKKYNWTPGHFINENFNMIGYLMTYNTYMLNFDAQIASVDRRFDHKCKMFIRPLGDGKEFAGEVFTGLGWKEYADDNPELKEKCPTVLYASPKDTQQEIRCWMIDGEPVTMSQYTIGRRVNYLNMDNNEEAAIFARQMAKIYQPARAFCLDICLYNDEYHIVELGCINHCGFYDANMGKLIDGLEKMKF